jgi:hypothetical protein
LYVGFEAFKVVSMKSTVFWVQLEIAQCFGGIYRFYLQDQRVSQARIQWKQVASLALSELHGAISQKTIFFMFLNNL